METMSLWDNLVEEALAKLQSLELLQPLRPIHLPSHQPPKAIENETQYSSNSVQEEKGNQFFQVFDKMQPWDRSSVEVQVAEETFQRWIRDLPSTGDEALCGDEVTDNEEKACPQHSKRLLLFSGNDYLGLSSHPTIGNAAAKAAQEHGMGPRGSTLFCGYTNYHKLLESSLANLKKKEQVFDNIINRDIPWPKIPEEMSNEAYDLVDKFLTENPVQRLGATGAREVKAHPFFKDINWDTLARQKVIHFNFVQVF
ncbi:8-amino-7-oxononanoate synthase-like [Corylus avellana]|uniref:8-amino-7-oxononanoate synthase-like n=1 Tax=Corylus avellana TaxID=13451 RepID=UPI00286BD690|nr:8-amino-7-oxononanoate synthase-like [Corylus avellana]